MRSGYKATQESLTDPTLAFPSRLIQQSINEAVTRQTATGSVETRRRAADKVISRQLPPSRPIQQSVGGAATRQAATGSVETHRRAADRVMSRRPAAELNTISDEDIFSDGWREDILPPYPELWLPPTHTRSIIAGAFHRDSVTPKEECAGRSAKYHRREGSFVKLRWETNIHQDVFRFVDTYDKHAKQVDFELMKTKTELEREVLFKAKAGIAEAARHYARDMQIYRARRNKRRYRFPTAALGPDPPEHIYYTLEELVNLVKKEIRLTNENRMRRRKNLKEIPSNSGMNVTKLDPITMEFLSEEDWNLVRHWRRLPKILSIPSTFDDSIANELPEVDLANLVKARYERGEDEYGRTAADRNSGESESSTGEDDEIATSSDEDDSNDEGN
ncbi:hypothetical protein FGG08_003363 [Glutinoglossum americanum]|uniref:Uncharacterized protein n=1 Tax=Glutinoglossum americanum TaxID=1670608 RepID=A0A9P8I7V2_9PEZI|nr:hypothetical protein FGG08_003363 [Glutinoglossum americanum]